MVSFAINKNRVIKQWRNIERVNCEDSTDKQVLMLEDWKPTGRNACWNIIMSELVKPVRACF